jgi:hypothetical protein
MTESNFDLVRLTRAKRAVDVCPNTIRKMAAGGLPLYRQGRAVFFSKAELAQHIRRTSCTGMVHIRGKVMA